MIVQAQKNLNEALSQNQLHLPSKLLKSSGSVKASKGSERNEATVLAPTDQVSKKQINARNFVVQ